MWRSIVAGVFGATLMAAQPAAAQPAAAQGPPDKGGARKLEAELEKLRSRVDELATRLKNAEAAAPERRGGGGFEMKKKEGKGPMGFGSGFESGSERAFGGKKEGRGDWADWAKKKKDFGGSWGKKGSGKDSPWAKKMEGKDPAEWAKMKEAFQAKKKDGKGFGKGPWWAVAKKDGKGPGFGGPPWARGGFGAGPGRDDDRHNRDIERRLERIQDEIEELRRELRRR